jgi:RHS repeat-associated protein
MPYARQGGSIIECETQVLGETIPLVGTPFSLHYRSNRVPGYQSDRSVLIPITSAAPPASLKRVDVKVEVAGQKHELSFPATPGQTPTTFTWDGLDVYGRKISGSARGKVSIGWVYDGVYQLPGEIGRNFGQPSRTRIELVSSRREANANRDLNLTFGPVDARGWGVAGWTLSSHHFYDPDARVLYRGDGRTRNAISSSEVLEHVAGRGYNIQFINVPGPAQDATLAEIDTMNVAPDGSLLMGVQNGGRVLKMDPSGWLEFVTAGSGFEEAGHHASETRLAGVNGVAARSDGAIYVSQYGYFGDGAIRLIGPDGYVSTVAGANRRVCFSGSEDNEGAVATDASLCPLGPLETGPDGAPYFVDGSTGDTRIWKVNSQGLLETVLGGGASTADGTSALDFNPGYIRDFTFGADGAIYFANNDYIYRIRPEDGAVERVAGGGNPPDGVGNGLPALEAKLSLVEYLAAAPDGGIYLAERSNRERVRYFKPGGEIRLVLGNGQWGKTGAGGLARRAPTVDIQNLAVAPDGTLYVSEVANDGTLSHIRAVTSAMPPRSDGEVTIAAEKADLLYDFDKDGRHLRTRHALTGADLTTFGYDAAGLLVEIRELAPSGNPQDDLVTTVERDASGLPTAVIGPYGARTELATDVNGFLSQVVNPENEAHDLTSSVDGLLASFIRPARGESTFTYDELGLLVRDDDPEGGFTELVRTQDGTAYEVALATAMGRTRIKRVDADISSGARSQTREVVDSAGFVTEISEVPGESRTILSPTGTETEIVLGPDPRLGMARPITESVTVTTPSGLSSQVQTTRVATVDPATNQLLSQVDTIDVNGRISTFSYDGLAREVSLVSHEGRTARRRFDEQGRLVEYQIGDLEPVSLARDDHGRVTDIVQGIGPEERAFSIAYSPSGLWGSTLDAESRATTYSYDAANRMVSVDLPGTRTVEFGYDANGNVERLRPPGRPDHWKDYTDLDQEAVYDPPSVAGEDPRTLYSYNLDRQLTTIDRPDAKVLSLGYDGFGRRATTTIPRGVYSFGYSEVTGQLQSIVAPSDVPGGEQLYYEYDGALVASESWAGTMNATVARSYDGDFRVAGVSVNGEPEILRTYDGDGLPVTAGSLGIIWDPATGLLTSTALETVTTSATYDAYGQIRSTGAAAAGTPIYDAVYERDKLGRITRKTESIDAVTAVLDYGYDAAGRLETVHQDSTLLRLYDYDSNGNRLSVAGGGAVTSAVYDVQDRLVSHGPLSMTYSDAGDLVSKLHSGSSETTNYSYDALGNLLEVQLPDGKTIEYVIDGRSRRIGKKVDGTLVRGFLYRDQLNPIAELDAQGDTVARFIYGTQPFVPSYMVKGGASYRILTDHLGSPRLVVDASTGVVAQRIDYDEYGKVTLDSNPDFQPFGFAGGIYDADTGLVRFGARDYDAEVGRWTTKDPIGQAGGVNLYTYVGNQPTNLIDPQGLLGPAILAIPLAPAAKAAIVTTLGLATAAVLEYGGEVLANSAGGDDDEPNSCEQPPPPLVGHPDGEDGEDVDGFNSSWDPPAHPENPAEPDVDEAQDILESIGRKYEDNARNKTEQKLKDAQNKWKTR